VAAGGVAVAVGVALLLAHTVHLRSSADATLRTASYLDATIDLERLVVDAETGLRGYVITGRRLFLAPQRAAAGQLPEAARDLGAAAESDGAFVAQAHALATAAHSYLTGYVPRVIGQVTSNPTAARSYATTAEGKTLVDGIRHQTARLERLISARQANRLRSARESANSAVTVGVIVLIVLTGLTLALGGVLGWLLLGRERARRRAEAQYRASAQTASTLQQSLLPAHLPDVPCCELAIRFAPAGEGDLVGGDFYDVFAVGEDGWALVVGDVCGKGAGAAAVTAMARWTLRSLAGAVTPPAEVLRALNDAMLRQDLDGRFITLVYALLEVRAEEARVTIACGGHPPAIVVSRDGEPMRVAASGDLLGVWPDIRLEQVELPLRPGDGLLLYTDGVTDQGPGPGRLLEDALSRLTVDRSAETLADTLQAEAERSGGAPRDDVAIIALRYVPPAVQTGPFALTAGSAAA
jgi:CHASE3 domain sensor protein